MHAYRDAVRRTAGAYVLYPGNASNGKLFEEFAGFHEVLPGLGAFAIRPRADGTAEGMDDLRRFLDDVIEHVANHTTARERVSYHVAESYTFREDPVVYGSLVLDQHDAFGSDSTLRQQNTMSSWPGMRRLHNLNGRRTKGWQMFVWVIAPGHGTFHGICVGAPSIAAHTSWRRSPRPVPPAISWLSRLHGK